MLGGLFIGFEGQLIGAPSCACSLRCEMVARLCIGWNSAYSRHVRSVGKAFLCFVTLAPVPRADVCLGHCMLFLAKALAGDGRLTPVRTKGLAKESFRTDARAEGSEFWIGDGRNEVPLVCREGAVALRRGHTDTLHRSSCFQLWLQWWHLGWERLMLDVFLAL